MVDNLTPQDQGAAMPDASGQVGKQGFFSTTAGRIVIIVGAVMAFLTIAGIVAAVVAVFWLRGVAEDAMVDISNQIESQTSSASTSTAGSESPASEPDEMPLDSIFTFRDIFDPLVKPAPATEPTETAVFEGAADTLYLLDIIVEDGVTKAILWYNGTEYTAAEGEILGATAWQVLDIGTSSAVMLFGDTQITLSVGQGLTENGSTTGAGTGK